MKALRVNQYGPAESIELAEIPIPEPKHGEIRVRVEASGISFVDMLVARGGYQVRHPLPFTPGSEFSGVVDAVAPGVMSGLRVGDRVCGSTRGAWAQYLCHAAEHLHPLPSTCDHVAASVVVVPYGTALYALRERGNLVAGETLLVLGAAGGVGYAAVQLGKALGARVIAVASTAAKRAALQDAGADEVVDSSGDWKNAVKSLVGPRGVDVVLDPVGDAATDTAFRTLGWGGRHLVVGFAGGDVSTLRTNLTIVKGASLVGVDFRQLGERNPEQRIQLEREVVAMVCDGLVKPLINGALPLERFVEAQARAQDRATVGRVVLTFE